MPAGTELCTKPSKHNWRLKKSQLRPTQAAKWHTRPNYAVQLLTLMWQEPESETALIEYKATTEEKFHTLADAWSDEVMHISSTSDLVKNSKYREIIKLGWDVVPYLLIDLRDNQRFWFHALSEITKIRPYDPGDTANPRRMTNAWIRWGERKGLIER
jgi:hypothetical protein